MKSVVRSTKFLEQQQIDRVCIVLPVYNESANIHATFDAIWDFAAQNSAYRFIFVDDGSTDATQQILQDRISQLIEPSKIELISYPQRRGKGWAVGQGMRTAKGDYVCFIDGDLAYSLEHLEFLVEKLQTHDMVIGCRNLAPINLKDVEPFRRLSGKIFNWVSRKILNLEFRDMQAGLKGFKISIARDLFKSQQIFGFAFDAELLYLARQRGYTIGEIPAFVSKNHKQKISKVNIFSDSIKMLISLMSIRYYHPRALSKFILLSFDLEEFDIPEEYGQTVSEEIQFKVSLAGLESVLSLLEQFDVRATFFVTANFAQHHPDLILKIAQVHEVASHGFYHAHFDVEDLEKSKQALEALINQPIAGFRMPRLKPIDDRAISAAGYAYNSSMNPTYLPGRYNNFFRPRSPYYAEQLLNLPVSVTPLVRFPLFWLSFKNLPLAIYQIAAQITLNWDGYLNLYFHPWEFTDISAFSLPGYVQKHSGTGMIRRLRRYLTWLKPQAEFITCSEFQTKLIEQQGWPQKVWQ